MEPIESNPKAQKDIGLFVDLLTNTQMKLTKHSLKQDKTQYSKQKVMKYQLK